MWRFLTKVRRYDLREDQWERIKDLLLGRKNWVGGTAKDNRTFVVAFIYRYRAGISWRGLPVHFGCWKPVSNRLNQDSDNEHAMIDLTIAGAYQHSAGAQKKRW